ncbi:MAG TPA: glycosyltransferase [Rhodanobacteraceae bacterium]|nr:glycosyltransferase [Rhodanobacteraceae bacterium]
MKIVLWGTYDIGKPRVRILRDGLRARGIEIAEIHKDIWANVEDKSALRGPWQWLRRGLHLIAAYPNLVIQYLRAPAHELVLICYPGQLDVLVLWPFARMRRKPIVFDWFISAFDTVVEDRHLLARTNPLAWSLWAGEWLAARLATIAFMDTAAHARRMEKQFRLAPGSVNRVWVGAEKAFFRSVERRTSSEYLQVLFYGQFIPLHGIDTIIEAAQSLNGAPIRWTLIGRGQEAPRIRALLAKRPVDGLQWLDWVPYERLLEHIAQADVCLGIFGTSAKAASVIPNKVFQVVAAGRPLITCDSPGIRELLADDPPCVRLVPAGDGRALATAIREYIDSRHNLPSRCHAKLRQRIDPAAVAALFLSMLEQPSRPNP